MKLLAAERSSCCYLFLHDLLKQKGLVINKKRIYRVYCEEKRQERTKARKKFRRLRQTSKVPGCVKERWSKDFVLIQLHNDRRFRVLNVVDNFSREMVVHLFSVLIPGPQAGCFLDELLEPLQPPEKVVRHNGTEFNSKAMFFWSK